MNNREKLIELLGEDTCHRDGCYDCDYDGDRNACIEYLKISMADHLIANGVTFSAAVPGHEDQYNIAEMSYNNGYEKGFVDGKRESVKRGRWIIHHEAGGRHSQARSWAECSECRVCGNPQWKVCPVCETKMEDT